MKIRAILGAVALMAGLMGGAEALTPEQALERVRGGGLPARVAAQWQGDAMSLRLAVEGEGTEPVYLFADPDGRFVVAAGDSGAQVALLGYGEGCCAEGDLPPQLESVLKVMARTQTEQPMMAAAQRAAIEPLVKSIWGQGTPYNDLAPALEGGEQAATGCVATAMAQIARFWQWPTRTSGFIEYSYQDYYDTTKRYSADISRQYDYTLMPLTTGEFASEVERQEVAELMNTCGAVSKMMWGLPSTGGSGAQATEALNGFVKYLGYTPSARMEMAEWYTPQVWTDLVYAELSAGRPVFYGGYGDGGGHMFICDGYSENEYFHINWGWEGMCDGYFLLPALNPQQQGTGGNSSGYNNLQSVIMGLEPAYLAADNTPAPPVMCVYGSRFEVEKTQYSPSGSLLFKGDFINYSPSAVDARLGVELYDPESGKSVYAPTGSRYMLGGSEGFSEMRIAASEFPEEGRFDVYPAFETEGVWRRMRYPIALTGPLEVECTSEAITFTSNYGKVEQPPFEALWEVTDVAEADGSEMPDGSVVYRGHTYRLKFDLLGSRDANVKTQAIVYANGREEARAAGSILSLKEGEAVGGSVTITIPDNTPEGAVLAVGLRLYNSDDIDLTLTPDRQFTVRVAPSEPVEPEYLDELKAINGVSPDQAILTFGEPFSLDYEFMTNVDLGDAVVSLGLYAGGALLKTLYSETVAVRGNELYTITAHGCEVSRDDVASSASPLHLGASISGGGGEWVNIFTPEVTFEDGQGGVATIIERIPSGEEEWYTLQGVRISRPRNGGIYLHKQDGRMQKRILK